MYRIGDAWRLAVAAASSGTEFSAEAHALGAATATVHRRLAEALHQAVVDTSRNRIHVIYVGVKPDLLRNEAQAIMTGRMGEDGVFHAEELLLKCPTRYEEAVPAQAASK